jgi:hypothetical protein
MKAIIILGAVAGMCIATAANAQRSQPPPPRDPPRPPAVIIDRTPQLPIPRERPINPPRTYQDISPPMQGPTPLSPMIPRVGNGG